MCLQYNARKAACLTGKGKPLQSRTASAIRIRCKNPEKVFDSFFPND
jgi:hypothetical protein